MMKHIPVLLNKVLEILEPIPGAFIIDGTVDGGGHAAAIIGAMALKGKFLAVDWDEKLLNETKKELEAKFGIPSSEFKIFWANDNYVNLPKILEGKNLGKADGLLLDLGFSSEQIEQSGKPACASPSRNVLEKQSEASAGKGFSFLNDEPLDMRYQPNYKTEGGKSERRLTAAEIINSYREENLADIFWKYGEERFSRRIAKKIVELRKKKRILTTFSLVSAVIQSAPKNYEKGRIHPATRVFQALRIYVNGELDNLETVLSNMEKILKVNGRVVIISFHSLEDRLVKNRFREMELRKRAEIITKKPVTAEMEEIKNNPRSRSAKLRAIKITK